MADEVLTAEEMAEKVRKYEAFANDELKGKLGTVLKGRDEIYDEISEYTRLGTTIEAMQAQRYAETGGKMKMKVDLGCSVFCQAEAVDPTRIMVAIGFGFFLEMTLPEAAAFVAKKTAALEKQAELLSQKAARAKAHIKLVMEGIREMQGLQYWDDDNPERNF